MIWFSCHSENFGFFGREDTFAFISRLGFRYIDVAARSFMPQSEIVAAPEPGARIIRDLGETYALKPDELFLGPLEIDGANIDPSAGDAAHDPEAYRRFEVICRYARMAGFSSVMGAAGTENAALGYEHSFENASAVLTKLVMIAADNGVAYHVEPSRNSLLNTPEKALRMIGAAPGLKYTLDFLHYQINAVPLRDSMRLIPHAGHMHARQAAAGIGKCDYERGEIDYDPIVQRLCAMEWSGGIAMEFWNGPEQDAQGICPVEQNIRMKYELKCLIRKYGAKTLPLIET
ncbi:MAG: sugar phosphate isomerase/epimerase [Treponema sp.]|jgi:sugar phosphate isomerase/epimerase|nr:sugar phosphate isomerase/epimerase [Treponema sp.]